MLRWLEDLATGQDPTHRLRGRSAHGGAAGTIAALWRRGWIDHDGITAAGLAQVQRQKVAS
jgi:hypothetical protein